MSLFDALTSALGRSFSAPYPETRFNCPACAKRKGRRDTKGHLYVSLTKQRFFCHRCNWKGTLDRLLGGKVPIQTPIRPAGDEHWSETLLRMSGLTGKRYTEDYDPTEEIEYPCDVLPPEHGFLSYRYLTFPKTELVNGMSCRGYDPRIIDDYRIQVGVGPRWGSRVFVPTFHGGAMTFWVARDISGREKAEFKYLNPAGRSRRYHVFNLDRARDFSSVVITEGVFSAIAAGPNAVALFGKFASAPQLQQLLDAGFRTYFVALDGDAREEAVKLAHWLQRRQAAVRLVSLPRSDDPDSVADFPARLRAARPLDLAAEAEFMLSP